MKDKNKQLEEILHKIATRHLPDVDALKKKLNKAVNKHPEQFSTSFSIFSDHGVLATKLPPIEEDYNGHVKNFASEHLQLSRNNASLTFTISELKRRFSEKEIVRCFEKYMEFKNEDKVYFERAISAYWDDDYLVSSHLFIPLIETTTRQLEQIFGGSIIYSPTPKSNPSSGYYFMPLGKLLRDGRINKFFSDNVLFYFQLVLTGCLGLNLRNDFAHGLGKEKFLTAATSDRLFHILIVLASIMKDEDKLPFDHRVCPEAFTGWGMGKN